MYLIIDYKIMTIHFKTSLYENERLGLVMTHREDCGVLIFELVDCFFIIKTIISHIYINLSLKQVLTSV